MKTLRSITLFDFSALFIAIVSLLLLSTLQIVDGTDVRQNEENEHSGNTLQHDGKKRVVTIANNNVKKYTKNNKLLLIFLWIDSRDPQTKNEKPDMEMLETVAQVMATTNNVVVSVCNIVHNEKLAKSLDVNEGVFSGMIKILNRGKSVTYNGQRSIGVIAQYLANMLEAPVSVVKKSERKGFEEVDLPKVLAYMEPNSKEFQAYESAAISFQPMVPFFVVHDSKVAKSMHLKKLNSIQFLKPFEKTVLFGSKEKITETNILKFINSNKKQRLTKMRHENIHDFWHLKQHGYLVPVFADVTTEGGKALLALGRAASKQFEKFDNLTFIWIDPIMFPGMVEHWRKNFGVNPTTVVIGAVDFRTQSSAWLDNEEGDKDEVTLREVKEWLNKVLRGEIELKPMKMSTANDNENGARKSEPYNERNEL